MKIKIISCTASNEAWYKNRVGEEFEGHPHPAWGDWNVGKVDGTGNDCLVAYEDAEEMEELVLKEKFR